MSEIIQHPQGDDHVQLLQWLVSEEDGYNPGNYHTTPRAFKRLRDMMVDAGWAVSMRQAPYLRVTEAGRLELQNERRLLDQARMARSYRGEWE